MESQLSVRIKGLRATIEVEEIVREGSASAVLPPIPLLGPAISEALASLPPPEAPFPGSEDKAPARPLSGRRPPGARARARRPATASPDPHPAPGGVGPSPPPGHIPRRTKDHADLWRNARGQIRDAG